MICLDGTFLKRLKRLARVSRAVGAWDTSRFPPAALSPVRPEWTSHRDYSPGDDWREVDWRFCARHDELFTRRPRSVPDGRLDVLLDCSPSMSLGEPAKLDVARQIAAVLAYLALDRLDEVRVAAFVGRVAAESGPMRGKSHSLALLRFLDQLSSQPGQTSVARTAADWVRGRGRRGPVAVISDFCPPEDLFAGLGVLCAHGFRPHLVQVFDPAETIPGTLGELDLCDVETGERWTTLLTPRERARYCQLLAEYRQSVRSFCNRHRIGYAAIPTSLTREELLLRATIAPEGVPVTSSGPNPWPLIPNP